MRTLFTALILVLLVNALALGGLLGWLGATDRLSKERVERVAALFSNTLEEQAALDKEAEQAEQEAVALAEKAIRMEQVAGGPVTPEARLESLRRVDENQQALLKRQRVESEALKRQLDTQMKRIEERLAELDTKQKAFDEAVQARMDEMQEQDFQEAVAMLEGLPPKQAKAVMQELLDQGSQAQVVDYLSAMQQRKAANVLTEFKQPNEVDQAAELIEKLRQRTDEIKEEAEL